MVNGITGRVDTDPKNVYENGRYFVWLRHYFLRFPRNRVNLEFSATPPAAALGSTTSYSLPTIPARTGPDPDDRESGGQPVDLQVAFQYRFRKELVPQVYQTFGTAWEPSYMRFAQQAITNVAQQFTPKMFWDRRTVVEAAMHRAVNQSMFTNGFAEVPQLQLLQVGFKDNYEATITNIQLQEQLKVTKNYQLEVTRVLKEVDILLSQTDVRAPHAPFSSTPSLPALHHPSLAIRTHSPFRLRTAQPQPPNTWTRPRSHSAPRAAVAVFAQAQIALIRAQGAREAAVIISQANAQALQLEQATKAYWYAQLKERMSWNNSHLLQYVKMKALNAQPSESMVVGVSPVGAS